MINLPGTRPDPETGGTIIQLTKRSEQIEGIIASFAHLDLSHKLSGYLEQLRIIANEIKSLEDNFLVAEYSKLKILELYLCVPKKNRFLAFCSICMQDESNQKFFVGKENKSFSFEELRVYNIGAL